MKEVQNLLRKGESCLNNELSVASICRDVHEQAHTFSFCVE